MTDSASTGSNLGSAISNFFHGISSLLVTGSWKVEKAASDARTAEVLLDRAEKQINIDAQKTLDTINDAITHYHTLERDCAARQAEVDHWNDTAQTAAAEAKKFAEGTEERARAEALVRSALTERARRESLLEPIKKALEESGPAYKKALDAIEQVGMSREIAKSTRERLSINQANAATRQALAAATQHPAGEAAQAMLNEASEKIKHMEAGADAAEDMAAHSPANPSAVDAQVSLLGQKSRVDSEFAALMGTSTPAAS